MDIISHGLWGAAAFGRKSRKNFWWAFFIGMAPDLFSFGIYTAATILGIEQRIPQRFGQNDMSLIPAYVGHLYNFTHSLIIFSIVFLIIWAIMKKPLWILGSWALHILVDIPSHSTNFFPTPFLWPLSNFHVNGISWGRPIIFLPNVILLIIVYSLLTFKKKFWFSHEKNKS